MPRRYFELSDGVYFPGRWELGAPRDAHGQKLWTWRFRSRERADLGLESSTLLRRFPTPAGEVLLVTLKALLSSELAFLLTQGRDGKSELARRFARESETPHLSRAWRKPVV